MTWLAAAHKPGRWLNPGPDGFWVVIGIMAVAMFVVLMSSCAITVPSPIEPRNDRIVWDHVPSVGTDDPSLAGNVESAVDAWGYGEYVLGCARADVCVTRGFLRPHGPHGQAFWEPYVGRTCEARIYVETWAIVAHEIGHCYGLGHSRDRRSVMYAYSTLWGGPMQYITISDRTALRSIRP